MSISTGWKRLKALVLEPSPEPFWRQVFQWKFLIGFLTVVLIVLGANQLWVFEYAGLFAKDSMTKWRPPRTPRIVNWSRSPNRTAMECSWVPSP